MFLQIDQSGRGGFLVDIPSSQITLVCVDLTKSEETNIKKHQ